MKMISSMMQLCESLIILADHINTGDVINVDRKCKPISQMELFLIHLDENLCLEDLVVCQRRH